MKLNQTQALTLSGMTVALYCAIMYLTQSFAFGPYQIRLATGLYSLSYLFPVLVLPLSAANMLSNVLMGGLGMLDVVGGLIVGLVTAGGCWLVRTLNLPSLLVIPIIILGPGLIVPIWLSAILGLPYSALALSLCVGQTPPAILGYGLIKMMERTWLRGKN